MKIKLTTDSASDLSKELYDRYDIAVAPMTVLMDDQPYKDGVDITIQDIYTHVDAGGSLCRTSALNMGDYLQLFAPFMEEYDALIHVSLGSAFSSSYQNACIAAQEFSNVYVVDSQNLSSGEGHVVLEAAKMRDAGYSFERTVEVLEQVKATGRIFFTIGSLDYLVHGGRIGRLTGLAAGTLGLKPLVTLHNGELYPEGVVHGRVKSRRRVIEKALEYMEQEKMNPDDYEILTGYGLDYAEAEKFRDLLEEELHKKYGRPLERVEIYQIGATIGVYTGPHPVGLGFIRHYDTF